MKQLDLAIVGSGTAARVVALRLREAGYSIAIIDSKPLGGTCALRGCDPKKVLISEIEVIDSARRMRGKGIEGDVHIRWSDLIAFKRTFTDPVPDQYEHRFIQQGIDIFHGQARFTGRNKLDVNGTAIEARHILIAAGAEPISLRIPGEEHLTTNEDFLALEQLPRRIVFVGGGYIAAEFSHIAARAGAQVTVLQRGERILTHFDPDLVGWLMEAFQTIGIDVRTRTAVTGIEKAGDLFRVQAASAGRCEAFEADLVVHAAGRKPALDSLDLAAADVAVEHGRLMLNDFLQSISNPAVYAAGDAANVGPPLTPVSSHDAKVVAANLLEGNHTRPNYKGVPSVAFALPPIAAVGLSEAETRESGLAFRMHSERLSDWFTARHHAQPVYGYKTLVEEETGRILGAHLVGPRADEAINVFAVAIRHGLTAGDIKSTMFTYPTGASDIASMLG